MLDPLLDLQDRLLRAGVGLRTARRFVAELRDHRDDIAEHLQAEGVEEAVARLEAERRLGPLDRLAEPMLADTRFRGLSSRLPALAYLVLPVAAQALASALPVLLLGLAATHMLPHAALPDFASAIAIAWLMLPVVVGWTILAAAGQRRARLGWPMLGAACSALLATALQLDITLPAGVEPGTISVALAMPNLLPLVVLLALSVLPLLLTDSFRNI